MKPLPHTLKLLNVAQRVIWFKEPPDALSNPYHFLAHVMTYGSMEDIKIVHDIIEDEGFREALEHAPPGIFDPRSWAYFNLKYGRHPVPPLPKRTLSKQAPDL